MELGADLDTGDFVVVADAPFTVDADAPFADATFAAAEAIVAENDPLRTAPSFVGVDVRDEGADDDI